MPIKTASYARSRIEFVTRDGSGFIHLSFFDESAWTDAYFTLKNGRFAKQAEMKLTMSFDSEDDLAPPTVEGRISGWADALTESAYSAEVARYKNPVTLFTKEGYSNFVIFPYGQGQALSNTMKLLSERAKQ